MELVATLYVSLYKKNKNSKQNWISSFRYFLLLSNDLWMTGNIHQDIMYIVFRTVAIGTWTLKIYTYSRPANERHGVQSLTDPYFFRFGSVWQFASASPFKFLNSYLGSEWKIHQSEYHANKSRIGLNVFEIWLPSVYDIMNTLSISLYRSSSYIPYIFYIL